MGREIRRVSKDWEHPKGYAGRKNNYQPMFDKTYKEAADEWVKGFKEYEPTEDCPYYWDFYGPTPDEQHYKPESTNPMDHFQAYETVSEGTPVSPVFDSLEKLRDYLVEHGDFWDQRRKNGGWTEEQAEAFIKNEYCFSGAIVDGKVLTARETATI